MNIRTETPKAKGEIGSQRWRGEVGSEEEVEVGAAWVKEPGPG